ncbi:hypothetical protein HDU86_003750 [Geranomyces michiganensis]|nr:hypothetical protein HDU86_003750 [Geranomyces michiganensis]
MFKIYDLRLTFPAPSPVSLALATPTTPATPATTLAISVSVHLSVTVVLLLIVWSFQYFNRHSSRGVVPTLTQASPTPVVLSEPEVVVAEVSSLAPSLPSRLPDPAAAEILQRARASLQKEVLEAGGKTSVPDPAAGDDQDKEANKEAKTGFLELDPMDSAIFPLRDRDSPVSPLVPEGFERVSRTLDAIDFNRRCGKDGLQFVWVTSSAAIKTPPRRVDHSCAGHRNGPSTRLGEDLFPNSIPGTVETRFGACTEMFSITWASRAPFPEDTLELRHLLELEVGQHLSEVRQICFRWHMIRHAAYLHQIRLKKQVS